MSSQSGSHYAQLEIPAGGGKGGEEAAGKPRAQEGGNSYSERWESLSQGSPAGKSGALEPRTMWLYPQQLPYRVGTSIRGKTQVSACRCHTGYGGDFLNTHPHGRAQKTPAHKAMSSQGLFPAGIAALALQSMETRPVRCSAGKDTGWPCLTTRV